MAVPLRWSEIENERYKMIAIAGRKERMDGLTRHPPFPLSLSPVFRAGLYLRPPGLRELGAVDAYGDAYGGRLGECLLVIRKRRRKRPPISHSSDNCDCRHRPD